MAKIPVSAKKAAQRIRRGPTLIQSSRSLSAEEKAIYHNVMGAGRSRVKREFFELGTDDQQAVKDGVEKLLKARIARAGKSS